MDGAPARFGTSGRRRWLWITTAIVFGLFVLAAVYIWAAVVSINDELAPADAFAPVALRPLPYPYKAALGLTLAPGQSLSLPDYFEALSYLNTRQTTRWGRGLGLEVGGAFTFYAPADDWPAYFNPPGPEGAANRRVFNRLLRAGWIDVLDSFGWRERFTRNDADRALTELEHQGLAVRVWADRFPSADNLALEGGRGDHPSRIAYHLDLSLKAGLRYFWLGRTTPILGQDVPVGLDGFTCQMGSQGLVSSLWNLGRALGDYVLAVVGLPRGDAFRGNRLLAPVSFKDGSIAYEYLRYRPLGRPAGLLALNPDCLDSLAAKGGKMIVYHELKPIGGQVWSPAELAVLEDLARRRRRGELLVTTAARLLTFTQVVDGLKWRFEQEGSRVRIYLESLDDAVTGPRPPKLEELAGLTFYVPRAAEARVFLKGKEVTIRRCLIDHTGRESVSLPWPRLSRPDLNPR